MRRVWFAPYGWLYRPVSWQGGLLVLMTMIFCIEAFIAVDRHSHSVSDTFFGVFPYVVPAFLLLNWIAAKSSN